MKERVNVLIGDIRRKCEGHGGGKCRADHQLMSQTSYLPGISAFLRMLYFFHILNQIVFVPF